MKSWMKFPRVFIIRGTTIRESGEARTKTLGFGRRYLTVFLNLGDLCL